MSLIINRMIDFQKLVLEAAGSNKKIKDFVSNNYKLQDLKTGLKNNFGIESTALTLLSDSWYRSLDEQILLRFTLGTAADPSFTNVFPYVDFLALFHQTNSIKFVRDNIDETKLNNVQQEFVNGSTTGISKLELRKIGSGNHPFFNYNPCSTLLKAEYPRIQAYMLESNIIGKTVVDNLGSTSIKKSIYTVVNSLQPTPKTSIPEDNQTIDDAIVNFSNYLPGSATPKTLPEEIKNVGPNFFALANILQQLVKVQTSPTTTEDFIKNKTIKDVKSDSSAEAKAFIEKLEELANVIPKNPTKEWSQMLSGAAQLAKGLASLGGPEMGR